MKIVKKMRLTFKGIDGIVIPIFKKHTDVNTLFKTYPELKIIRQKPVFKGKTGESSVFFSLERSKIIIIIGSGGGHSLDEGRKLAKSVISIAKENQIKKLLLHMEYEKEFSTEFLTNFIDYLFLNNYEFIKYKKRKKTDQIEKITIYRGNKKDKTRMNFLVRDRTMIDKSIKWVRDLINEPPTKLNPDYLVKVAYEMAANESLDIKVMRRQELIEKQMNGILSVGAGSCFEPALIKLSYQPQSYTRHIVLIGKGITFDSGGLNIKTGSHMNDMKSDMVGAALVLGALKAAVEMGFPLQLTALLPIAENMPGQCAYKPGDIILYRNNKSVEIVNTDAEGRLALADALIEADRYKPDYIIEFSTLTGSIITALGDCFAGLMCRHTPLRILLEKAGHITGDRVWSLPLFAEYQKSIKSIIADLKNADYNGASSIKAGLFLQEFVQKSHFAHIDIAGTAFLSKTNSFFGTEGATGYGIRLLMEFFSMLTKRDKSK